VQWADRAMSIVERNYAIIDGEGECGDEVD